MVSYTCGRFIFLLPNFPFNPQPEFPTLAKRQFPDWIYGIIFILAGIPCLVIPGYAICKLIRNKCYKGEDRDADKILTISSKIQMSEKWVKLGIQIFPWVSFKHRSMGDICGQVLLLLIFYTYYLIYFYWKKTWITLFLLLSQCYKFKMLICPISHSKCVTYMCYKKLIICNRLVYLNYLYRYLFFIHYQNIFKKNVHANFDLLDSRRARYSKIVHDWPYGSTRRKYSGPQIRPGKQVSEFFRNWATAHDCKGFTTSYSAPCCHSRTESCEDLRTSGLRMLI
jgi:hypothetical protein